MSLVGGNLLRQKFLTATASTATTTTIGSPAGTKSIILTKVHALGPGQVRPGILQPKTAKLLAFSAGQFTNVPSQTVSVTAKETPATATVVVTTAVTAPIKVPTTNSVTSSPMTGRPNIIRSPVIVNRNATDPTMGVSSLGVASSSRRKTAHLLKEDPSVLEKKASPVRLQPASTSVKDEIKSDVSELTPDRPKQAEVMDKIEVNEQPVATAKESLSVLSIVQLPQKMKEEEVKPNLDLNVPVSFDPFACIEETGKDDSIEEKEIDVRLK